MATRTYTRISTRPEPLEPRRLMSAAPPLATAQDVDLAYDGSGRLHLAWPTVVGGHEPAGAIFYASAGDGGGFSPRVRVPALAGRDPEHVQIAGAKPDRLIVGDEVVEGKRTVVASRLQLTAGGATGVRQPWFPPDDRPATPR